MSKLTQRIASLLASARLSTRDITHIPAEKQKRASVARAALIAASRRDVP